MNKDNVFDGVKRAWISVNDEPVPCDCDVVICYEGWVRLDEHWKKGLQVSLARAWGSMTRRERWQQVEHWLEKPSFFRWPDKVLISYSEITHWMPFEGFPEPPVE